MILLTMLIIPTLVALGFYFFSKKKITLGEFAAQNAIQIVFMSAILAFVGSGSTWDTEVWNGRVESKYSQRVSCSHSYTCNCRTSCSGSGKNRSCSTVCQTCYEHSYDMDWMVKTTNDERIEIDRVNRQGTMEPPRWTAVQKGEPTAVTHSYTNYIKAAPDSLFRRQGLIEKYKNKLPTYPGNIHDYYKLNRLITIDSPIMSDTVANWNKDLSELNADLGRTKHVNIILVFTKNISDEYYYALEQHWIGSKQNDFVVVANTDTSGKVTWVNVMAFTQNKIAEIVVRDSILKIGTLNKAEVLASIRDGVQTHFIKRSMSDFEYLKDSVTPSTNVWIASMILGLILSIGIGIVFLNNNYDDEDEGFVILKKGSDKMNTFLKVALGVVGLVTVLGLIAVFSVIGINNDLIRQEAGLTAQYKQNKNNYDNMVKKVLEVAQVPAMYTDDLKKVTEAAISGRYGKDGSKAVFQFIKEQNPTVNSDMYTKIQTVIEAGRNSFEANQTILLDKKRVYEQSLKVFPSNIVATFLGFPKIDLDKIDIVTSDRTDDAFEKKKDKEIELRK